MREPSKSPEPHRLIRCFGRDRMNRFEIYGQFLPYDHGSGARFCIQRGNGTFEPDRATWNDVSQWEYVNNGSNRSGEIK